MVTMSNRGTGKYEQLLERCRNLEAIPTAVVHPCEASALAGAMEAAGKGLIRPTLVGPVERIKDVAEQAQVALGDVEIVDTPHSHESATQAVQLVCTGRAELLMKGSLHTDELMAAVVSREAGLRTARRISHAFVMDVPTYHKTLIVTDAAINIAPTLEDKVDICQNAIDLANADSAGLVLGAKVPVILTSRADSVRSRIASCAVAMLAAHARREAAAGSV